MLTNYSPLLTKYQELWAKYSNSQVRSTEVLTTPKLATQEDSIKWSLVLKEALATLAQENKVELSDLINAFLSGATTCQTNKEYTRTHWGMSRVNLTLRIAKGDKLVEDCNTKAENDEMFICFGSTANDLLISKQLVDRFGLFFDFNSPEDLFLSDESDITSVYLIE